MAGPFLHSQRLVKLMIAVAALLCVAAPGQAQIRARVARIGLTARDHPMRLGDWVAMETVLTNEHGRVFSGEIRLEQLDRDGDVVVSATPFSLAPGQARPFFTYFIPSSIHTGERLSVRFFDEDGVLIHVIDEQGNEVDHIESETVEVLRPSQFVVIDVIQDGSPPLVRSSQFPHELRRDDKYPAATIRPDSDDALPDRWHGLGFADGLVFNDADFSRIDDSRLRAVVDWVRHGGRLVLAVNRNWESLERSPLSELLPATVKSNGDMSRGEALSRLMSGIDPNDPPAIGDSIRRVILAPTLPDVSGVYRGDGRSDSGEPLIYRRVFGRGLVTMVGASLTDLVGPRVSGDSVVEVENTLISEFDSTIYGLPAARVRGELFRMLLARAEIYNPDNQTDWSFTDPYTTAERQVAFNQNAGGLVLFALFFTGAYLVVSTFGTWMWLSAKKLTHHAWSVTVIVAGVSLVLGLMAVLWLRGISAQLHTVEVVDTFANRPAAVASCLFGLKTPKYTRTTVRLPITRIAGSAEDDFGPITPMPPTWNAIDNGNNTFVAPVTYTLARDGRAVADVVNRATLKQFSGDWEGPLDGQIDARLVVQMQGGRNFFVKPSFIKNSLACDLYGCFIIETPMEYVGESRQKLFYVHPIGNLSAGAEFRRFDRLYFKPLDPKAPDVPRASFSPSDFLTLRNMLDKEWFSMNGSVRLSSTFSDDWLRLLNRDERQLILLALADAADGMNARPVQLGSWGRLPVSHQISRHNAMLVGFSSAPGPGKLEVDGAILRPAQSLTMYRCLISIERAAVPVETVTAEMTNCEE